MSKNSEEIKLARKAASARGTIRGANVSAQGTIWGSNISARGTVWGGNDSALDNALHYLRP